MRLSCHTDALSVAGRRRFAVRQTGHAGPTIEGMSLVNDIDELFNGELVMEVPALEAELGRKSAGDQDGDNKGDHCNV